MERKPNERRCRVTGGTGTCTCWSGYDVRLCYLLHEDFFYKNRPIEEVHEKWTQELRDFEESERYREQEEEIWGI